MQFAEKFSLYRVFTSHMVLQRERPIVISGIATPDCAVRVTFAGTNIEAIADKDGQWSATFPAMSSGGEFTLTVSGKDGVPPIVLEDILIGEVWMCTGQSNMEMPIDSLNPFFRLSNPEEVLKTARNAQIRLYNVMPYSRLSPDKVLDDVNGVGWQLCDEKTAADFSACGYFFGRQLQADLDVPIGLIVTVWGGTPIEAWISQKKYKEMSYDAFIYHDEVTSDQFWKKWSNSEIGKKFMTWLEKFDSYGVSGTEIAPLNFDDSTWDECEGPIPLPAPGRYACRITFDLAPEFTGKTLQLHFNYVNDVDRTYFNGELIGSTGIDQRSYWVCPRDYTVPDSCVRSGKNCITIIADNHFAQGAIDTADLELSADGKVIRITPTRKFKTLFVLPDDFPVRPEAPNYDTLYTKYSPRYPSTLFNGVLYAWFRYAVRGMIWYQGCSNNGAFSYYPMHKMFIDDMREHWNDPEMPFLLVQLAAIASHQPENRLNDTEVDATPFAEYPPYAVTREIQAEMPRVRKNVGMITAFDCGDHSDIHPRDKETLGFRLAKKAEAMVYGKNVPCDGPEFAGFRQEKNRIRVFFRNTGSGLTTCDGKPPMGFVLGDSAGNLYRANAEIDGDSVVLDCPELLDPQRVRYAFTMFCRVNLMNKEGFPALPFRSDKVDYEPMYPDIP
ncbi:MAG: hypothetical protein LBM70_02010 [Victivallales bacterium]|jgi:sialate O-acetylesterase|nr:hypothetical protein [Victivallales bacterium]